MIHYIYGFLILVLAVLWLYERLFGGKGKKVLELEEKLSEQREITEKANQEAKQYMLEAQHYAQELDNITGGKSATEHVTKRRRRTR